MLCNEIYPILTRTEYILVCLQVKAADTSEQRRTDPAHRRRRRRREVMTT